MLNKKQKMRRQFCNAIAIVPAHFYTRGGTVRNKNLFRCIFLLLFAISFIIFSFRDRLHSETDTSGILLETNPRGIAINPETDVAVIAVEKEEDSHHHSESGHVAVVDLNIQKVISKILIGKEPKSVAIDSGLNIALVSNSKDNTISVVDLNTYQLITTIPVGKKPEGIAINQLTHIALVANHKDDTVSIIDLMTYTVINTIPVGKEPKDVAIDSELNLCLVANEKGNEHGKEKDKNKEEKEGEDHYTVSVIDLNTYQVTGTVSVGKKPQAIDINPETHLAAVVNEKDNSITVIDLQTWQTSTIQVGKHPIDIAINSLDNHALVVCDEDRSLLLIDLDTKSIIKNYSLNKEPKGIAVNNYTNMAAIVDDKTDSLMLIQLPSPIPEILSIAPDNTLRGSNDLKVNIEGNRFITSSIVFFDNQPLTTTFTDNHQIQATIPKEMLSKAGTFPITISNPAPGGGTSNSISFTVNNPIPSITALEPVESMAGTSGLILSLYGAGFFNDTEVYLGGVKKLTTYINSTELQIWLTSEDLKMPGQYEVTAYNLPPGGGNSNKVLFTVKNPLEIKITSPSDGETINKSKIIVKGTLKSDTKDVGIKVSGIIAEIMGNEWIANNIPFAIGSNIITATATDSYGNTDTKTITVYTNDITQLVELSANITSGIAPLEVFFSASTSFTPVSYQMDFEGDGVIDYTGAAFEDISHTYTTEGIFYPTLTVTDNQGNTYSDTIAITVLNKTEIDTLLKGKWEGMKEALVEGNIEGALKFFVGRSADRYRSIFEALKDQLPVIMGTFIELNIINVFENISEYEIVANENGQLYSYPGVFIRNGNGIWKFKDF